MADINLRDDLDDIASALEKKGRADLSAIVDLCNNQIHTRKASVKKPQRAARKASSDVSTKSVAGDTIKKLRWARAELKDLAREFRKAGSMSEARALLKCAEDLAEEESTMVEGPVVEGSEPAASDDFDFDVESETEECPPCPPCEDDEAAEAAEEAAEGETDEEIMEEALPELPTVAACVREMRALAKELSASKDPQDRKAAAVLRRQAMHCEAEGEVVVVELPPTDGGSDPVDATDFDFGDDDLSVYDIASEPDSDEEIVSDSVLDLEGEDEDAGEETMESSEEAASEIAEETTPSEYMEASATLERTAHTLKARGYDAEARKLLAKAMEFKKAARVASTEAKTPLKASVSDSRKAAFDRALKARKSRK